MGTEVRPEDRMTCDEIRLHHSRGSPVYILAELNACSEKTIERILAGEDVDWKPRKKRIVVNVDEGIIYPSIREAERREGIKHNSLAACFSKRGARVVFKGTKYHLYERRC